MKIRVIESILLEATPEEKYKQYKQLIDDYEVYIKIVGADPTSLNDGELVKFGNYSNWLLKLYLNNKLQLEDLYKVTEYLTIFDKFKKTLEIKERDISLYKSLPDLYKVLNDNELFDKTTKRDIRRVIHSGKDDIELIYEDSNILVVVPLTKEASCYWGTGTEWCTATRSDNNMFNEYNKRDKLYIIINKHNENEKYQFHFDTNSFMDKYDEPINLYEFFFNSKIYKPLVEVFYDKIKLNVRNFLTQYSNEFALIDKGILYIGIPTNENIILYLYMFLTSMDKEYQKMFDFMDDNIVYYTEIYFYYYDNFEDFAKILSKQYKMIFSNEMIKKYNIINSKKAFDFITNYQNRVITGAFKEATKIFNDYIIQQLLHNFSTKYNWIAESDKLYQKITNPYDIVRFYCFILEKNHDYIKDFFNIDKDFFNIDIPLFIDDMVDNGVINKYIKTVQHRLTLLGKY